MTILILLLLVATAAVLVRTRRRQGGRILFVLAGILIVSIGCGPLPALVLKDLEAGYSDASVHSWQQSAAIIVLGGGLEQVADTHTVEVPAIVYGRIVKTLELYLQCKRNGKACIVIVSGGDPARLGVSEAKVYGAVLTKVSWIWLCTNIPGWCAIVFTRCWVGISRHSIQEHSEGRSGCLPCATGGAAA
jgi:uncharacterized SAM-binding protein YcdF (DUF218 family)